MPIVPGAVRPPQQKLPHSKNNGFLINPQSPRSKGKKTLVLDLDETLVHSSFNKLPNPSFLLPIHMNGTKQTVYVKV